MYASRRVRLLAYFHNPDSAFSLEYAFFNKKNARVLQILAQDNDTVVNILDSIVFAKSHAILSHTWSQFRAVIDTLDRRKSTCNLNSRVWTISICICNFQWNCNPINVVGWLQVSTSMAAKKISVTRLGFSSIEKKSQQRGKTALDNFM